jgi:hypothetical protein
MKLFISILLTSTMAVAQLPQAVPMNSVTTSAQAEQNAELAEIQLTAITALLKKTDPNFLVYLQLKAELVQHRQMQNMLHQREGQAARRKALADAGAPQTPEPK